ncbi:hypothetical protein SAMN05444920_104745 [Nonomuraea solani]|uniref:Uncharacterized protein n=1 Tax=Nonomuraea solani TaxID=1144553 RepID=A0A1H6D397_9ACTN|nr:hypothetical protein [Nonomuraea solani]SEG79741.1 hypothetical protein SAMN05444920_104745 [Nonomuraea solani]
MTHPHDRTQPVARPASGTPRRIFREEALRSRARARSGVRMPLVISGPSFLVLWIAVAIVLTAGVAVTALALGTVR